MSMYRQLWLAIIVSMLLALVGSLLASLLSARSYLEQQLSMKNADNAAALALSLSQQNPDRSSLWNWLWPRCSTAGITSRSASTIRMAS
jgi:hypothetical protein